MDPLEVATRLLIPVVENLPAFIAALRSKDVLTEDEKRLLKLAADFANSQVQALPIR